MRWRNTLVALIILALLGGYVGYFVWGGHGAGKSTPTPASTPILHDVKFDNVDGVLIAGKDRLLSLHKTKDDKWEMLAPRPGPADGERVGRVLRELVNASPKRVITGTLQLGDFGLDKPAWYITLRGKDNEVHTLEVGNKNPNGLYYYVRLDKGKKVYMLSAIAVDDVTDMVSSPPLQKPTPVATPTSTG